MSDRELLIDTSDLRVDDRFIRQTHDAFSVRLYLVGELAKHLGEMLRVDVVRSELDFRW